MQDTDLDQLVADFTSTFGREPDGVWMAPGRVNLIGEHTDYNDGFVLPFALAQRTYAAVAGRADGPSRLRSTQEDGDLVEFTAATTEPGEVKGWGAYVAGVSWAMRTAGHPAGEYDILIDGRVPIAAGLSSSAALECAVALALADLGGLDLSRAELARLARQAENDYAGAPTGVMDQMASLFGQAGQLIRLDTRTLDVRLVPLPLARFSLELLVINTNTPHALVDGPYAQRRRTCSEAAELLGVPALRDVSMAEVPAALERLPDDVMRRRVRHVVTENDRLGETAAALESGADPRTIGPLLTASHESLRDDYEVSVAPVDLAVATALAAGAHGARITGGGFGGCAIALVDSGTSAAVFTAVADAYELAGFDAPDYFVAEPSDGAARLR